MRSAIHAAIHDERGMTPFELGVLLVVIAAGIVLIVFGIRQLTFDVTNVACAGHIRTIRAQYLIDFETTRPDGPEASQQLFRSEIRTLYPDARIDSINSTVSGICPGGGTYQVSVDDNGLLTVVCSLHRRTEKAVSGIPSQITVDSWSDTLSYAHDYNSAVVPAGTVYHDRTGTFVSTEKGQVTSTEAAETPALSTYSITHSWLVPVDFGAVLTTDDQATDSGTGLLGWKTIPAKGSLFYCKGRYYVFSDLAGNEYSPTDPDNLGPWVILSQS